MEVVTDPEGDGFPPTWRPYRTYRECLARPTEAAWVLVLQDDVTLCPGFPDALTSCLSAAGEHPVSLFTSNQALQTRKDYWARMRAGEAWCPLNQREWVNVVALAWPTSLIPKFLAWADGKGFGVTRGRADDAIVGEWARMTRTQVLATVPSLVEHPDWEPSVAQPNRRGKGPRTALLFASEGAAHVDWAAGGGNVTGLSVV